MILVAESGESPHPQTGELISGAPKSFILFEEGHIGHLTDAVTIAEVRAKHLPDTWEGIPIDDFFLPRTMSIRQCGKKANHGLNYREEYATFALTSGLDEKDAKTIIAAYRGEHGNTPSEDALVAYPELRKWYHEIEESLRSDNRTLNNCYGQTRQFLDKWGQRLFNQATAFIPQSTVGNITNRAMRGIYHYGNDRIALGAQVHDSLLTHHKFSSFDELADQIRFVGECFNMPITYRDVTFSLNRDVTLGVNWGARAMIAPSSLQPSSLETAYLSSLEASA